MKISWPIVPLFLAAACTSSLEVDGGLLSTEAPERQQRPQPVAIFYDQNGEPNLTFFSASVTATISGAIPTLNRPDLYGSRTFTETFSWQTGQDWDVTLSFSTNPSPFSGAPAPLYDISSARLNFATRVSDFRLRSGGQLPLPPASVTVFVPGGTSTQVPSPSPMPTAAAHPGAAPSPAENRSGFTQSRVVSPAGSARTLAQLRARFTETRIGQRSVFRRAVGDFATEITYDHDEGLIVSSVAEVKGRRASTTSFVYADSLGLKLLRSERTVFYDANGRETYRTSRMLSNIQLETEGGS